MRRFPTFLAVFVAIALVAALSVPAAAENAYVGADSCKMCHKKDEKGNQYAKWQESKHANAYATLATDKAKEIADGKGIANAQEAQECLKCHVTAAGVDASLLDKKYKVEDGVGCESCHGAGKAYKKKKVMEDRDAAVAAGLVIPTEATCTACHNEESPTYQAFDYAARSAEIAHPNPSK
jgi:hypothetical protein